MSVEINVTDQIIEVTPTDSQVNVNITETPVVVNATDNIIEITETGLQGPQGPAGPGVPTGGTTGQILAKIDGTNFNTEWIDNYTTDVREYVKAGEAINKGQAVYVSGADGTNIIISKASNDSEAKSSKTLGLLIQNLAKNDMGYVITDGILTGLNTIGATAGDPVWLGTNGNLVYGLVNKPSAPANLVYLGVVTRVNANNGEVFVHVVNGFELQELHNVSITNPANGQVLTYDSVTGLWKNQNAQGTGTVTSVGISVPTGLSVSNSPVTTSGTIAIGYASGYSIPTSAKQSEWNSAYNDKINSASVTGTTTKTLTLNQQDGGTITASWTDINTDAVSSVFGRTGEITAQSGDYTTTQVTEGTNLYYTDARGRGSVSAGTGISYDNSTGVITNASPDQVVSLTGAGTTSVTGTYPNFTISSDDQYDGTVTSVGLTAGTGISVSGSPIISSGSITVTNTAPDQIVSISGSGTTSVSGTYPSFTITTNDQYTGTVTSVSTSAPLTGGTITSTGTIGINKSSTSSDGYLSSTDFTTFNNKQNTLILTTLNNSGASTLVGSTLNVPNYTLSGLGGVPTTRQLTINGTGYDLSLDRSWSVGTITSLTGEASGSGTGAVSVTLSNSAVIGKVLTGLNLTGGGTISATDSILQAFGKVQNQISALVGSVQYEGVWNATTNSPTIASGVGSKGDYYVVNVAGTTTIDGISDWKIGDWIIFNGSTWDKVDNTDAVSSVNGYTGAVSLSTSDIGEGTNLYFTNTRAQNAITLTTSGTSGSATYSGGTLNIPTYSLSGLGGVPTTRTLTINGTAYDLSANRSWSVGTVTSIGLSSTTSGITIGSTPVTGSGTITIDIATASSTQNGLLSSTDWATFNGKQSALNGTGFVKISGTTISYDNSTYLTTSNAASTYVPLTRTITINGTALDLSVNRSWSVGTVTSVGLSSSTSGVTIGSTPVTGSGTITLSIATASGSQNGLLSSTDWTTFNNKQNALTNPVTGTGTINYIPKFTGTSTIGNSSITDDGTIVTSTTNLYINKANPFLRFKGSTLDGYIINSSDKLYIADYATATKAIVLDLSTGNTGIGTSSPATLLHIEQSTPILTIRGTGSGEYGLKILDASASLAGLTYFSTTGEQRLNGAQSYVYQTFYSGGSERMRITSGGRILMGTSTDNGTDRLQVSGSATFSSSVTAASFNGTTNNIFSVSGSEQMRLTSTGLGIGTSSPNTNLHIYQSGGDGISEVKIEAAGVANPRLTLLGASPYESQLYYSQNLSFYNSNANALRLVLDASGNLGLGVTPSAWGSSSKVLEFSSGAIESRGSVIAIWANSFFNGTSPIYKTTAAATNYYQLNGEHVWLNAPSGTAGNAISFTQAMTLDASGRLGIGTTSPTYPLTVISNSSTQGIRLAGRSSDNIANMSFTSNDQGTEYAFVNTSSTYYAIGTNGSERMRITSGGRILMNNPTDDTSNILQVAGGIRSTTGIDYNVLKPTTTSFSSTATLTPNLALGDTFVVTDQAASLTIAAPSGTPVNGQKMILRIRGTAARALSWNGIYRASSDLPLPTTTTSTRTMYLGFIYNSVNDRWDLIAFLDNFAVPT